ncbi:phytanoyl-CoA dioxygenase family protein [Botrimarina sp.]|uniref:phytanoyl-CoA dioxygenase family protein n=1 Tax=Botrimarina sp. TaxID=2795802 RepID=UPI0032ED4852
MPVTTESIDVQAYRQRGYVAGLPVLNKAEVERAQQLFRRLSELVPAGASTMAIDWWHQLDRELFDLCMHPNILDYVEQIVGPDFYLWGSQFFAKEPHSGSTVPWHQDAFYWPLKPHKAVTVWLAVEDSFAENGAMMVVPGTHTRQMSHRGASSGDAVLDVETCDDQFDPSEAVTLAMTAGECSMHDDNIVHGSRRNDSDRVRCGLTIRFSAGDSECDTSVWPFFKAYWARGVDRWGHNPIGEPPKGVMTEFQSVTPRTGQR